MKTQISKLSALIRHDWNANAVELLKCKMKESGISQNIFAELIGLPLPTFNDKIAGKTPLKLNEVAMLSLLLGVPSDVLIFGEEDFVKKFWHQNKKEIIQSIKKYLTDNQKYEVLGKLLANGFFKS
jgi:hypothetical protein